VTWQPEPQPEKDVTRPSFVWDWIAFVSAAVVLVLSIAVGRGASAPLRAVGVVVLILSIPLIFLPFVLLTRYGGVAAGAPYYDTSRVVERGPYTVVRHPQYLGYMLLLVGFVLLSQHLLTTLPAAVAVAALLVHTVQEEQQCERRMGDAYRAYMRRVPRFNLPVGVLRLLRRNRGSTAG
jgi:protein-S-isoprenylcysteine O-methyltransferase Ste14